MCVGGHKTAFLLVYSPVKQVCVQIERDESAIEKLLEKGKWFYDLMQSNTLPPQPVVFREDADAIEFAESAKALKAKLNEVEEEWSIMRDSGIFIANEQSFECNGVKVVKIPPRVTIDYKAALESIAPGIDLSAFKKISKPTWRVTA